MADVAQLGLAVDSSQVKSATAALNQLNQASAAAQRGATNLAQAGQKSETAMRAIDAAAKRAGISTAEMEARVNAASAAHNKMSAASATAVKGIQQLSQQAVKTGNDNKQLGAATEKTNGTLDKFASRFVRGLIAGATLTGVQQLTQYVLNLNAAIAATADTALRVNIGGQQFQGLQAAAGNKGIGNSDFNAAMITFNQQLDLAKHGLGDLRTLLTSNGQTIGDTASTLGRVADLVQKATGNYALQVSILQQAGLPATQQWVQLFEQGSTAINKIADASTKLSNQQLEEARKLNDQWNELWTNFETWGKKAVVNVFEAARALKNAVPVPAGAGELDASIYGTGFALPAPRSSANPLASPTPVVTRGPDLPAPKPTASPFDPALARQQISLEQQRLSILGPLATVEDQVRAKQLEINQAALNNVSISKTQRDALLLITRAQAELSRVNQQAQIGVFDMATAQKAANDNLRALVAERLLDPNNAQQWAAATTAAAKGIEQLAQNAKVAAAPLEGLQRLANDAGSARTQLDQFATTSLNGLSDGLVNIVNGSQSAGAAFSNFGQMVVTALEKMIIQMTIIKPLADALQAALGGGMNFLNFLGLGGGGLGNALPSTALAGGGYSAPIGPTFAAANGGTFGPGWGVVGERGPELIKVHSGGVTVIPNHISRPYLPGFADGGMLGSNGSVTRLPFGQDNRPLNISIINQSSQPVTATAGKTPNGDPAIFLRDAVRGIMAEDAANNGPISEAFAARAQGFGAR